MKAKIENRVGIDDSAVAAAPFKFCKFAEHTPDSAKNVPEFVVQRQRVQTCRPAMSVALEACG
jgi:hypothetical protein